VLIEEQMELVKRRAGDLPMRFLTQVSQRHGVGRELAELCRHLHPAPENQAAADETDKLMLTAHVTSTVARRCFLGILDQVHKAES
jgi:hypothetical protein